MLPMLHVLVLKFIKLVKYNINSNNEEAVGVVVGNHIENHISTSDLTASLEHTQQVCDIDHEIGVYGSQFSSRPIYTSNESLCPAE